MKHEGFGSLKSLRTTELKYQLIAASGTNENCSPQFETLLNDRFLKALPSEIAANSGTWTYTDLRYLVNCATQAMTSSKRYGKSKVVLKIDKSEASDVKPKKFLNNWFVVQNFSIAKYSDFISKLFV